MSSVNTTKFNPEVSLENLENLSLALFGLCNYHQVDPSILQVSGSIEQELEELRLKLSVLGQGLLRDESLDAKHKQLENVELLD